MVIEWSILWAVIAIWGILSWLGLLANIFVRTKHYILFPSLGLIVFGGLIAPAVYLQGHYSTISIFLATFVLGSIGAVMAWRRRGPWSWPRPTIRWWAGLGVIALLASGLVFSSKYYIPGGIDSAIHSSIINGILIHMQRVQGPYPLGLHLFILFIERTFNLSQVAVFQGLNLFFYLSFLIFIYVLVRRWIDFRLAGVVAVIVSLVDVSYFNNLINGSISHLLSLQIIIIGIVLLYLTKDKSAKITSGVFLLLLSSMWYYNFLSLYFVFLALWPLRVFSLDKQKINLLWALLGSLVLSIPVQIQLLSDPTYVHSSLPAVLAVIILEPIIFYGGKIIKKIFSYWLTLYISLPILIWLFFMTYHRFLTLISWYGGVILCLTGLGALFIVITKKKNYYGWYYYLFVLFTLFYLTQRNVFGESSSLITELMYYYGFTIAVIVLATIGLWHLFQALESKYARLIMLATVSATSVIIISARTFDRNLIRGQIQDDKPISRYGQLSGFGIFYTKNDIRVAESLKMKTKVLDQSFVMNPGGLYNDWASLTEHQTVLSRYNNSGFSDYPVIEAEVRKFLGGAQGAKASVFTSHTISYLLLPENFQGVVFDPHFELLQHAGQARLYRIHEQPQRGGQFYPVDFANPTMSKPLTITGKYDVSCRYCGNPFYFTLKDAINLASVPAAGTLSLSLPSGPATRVNLYAQVDRGSLEVTINGQVVPSSPGAGNSTTWTTRVLRQRPISIVLRNVSTQQPVILSGLAAETNAD